MASLEEEPLLFSISLYPPSTPPPNASSGGEAFVDGEDDDLSLEQRHGCACHFVSRMHQYFASARFIAHVHADIPERLLREVYEASGYRTRFISYEIVSKICDAPVQPGAIPVPTGRLPAVAAAAAAAAADAVREAAAAAAEGGGGEAAETKTSTGDIQAYGLLAPTVEVAQPKVRGNIIAGSLIGATFGRSFGADGTWEGTVVQFIDTRNRPGSGKAGGASAGRRPGGGKDAYGSGVEIVDGYVKDPNGKYRRGPGGWSFVVEQSSPATLGEKTTKAKSVAQSRAPAGSKGAKLIHQARGGGVGGGSSKGAGSGRSKSLPAGSASSAGRGAGGTGGRKRPIAAVGGCSSERASRRLCTNKTLIGDEVFAERSRRYYKGIYTSPGDETLILRMAFWSDIWPALVNAGWRLETVVTHNRNDKYYYPKGIYRGPGKMVRRDFFDSARQVVDRIKTLEEWAPLLKSIVARAKSVKDEGGAHSEAGRNAQVAPLPVIHWRSPPPTIVMTPAPLPAPTPPAARSKSRSSPAATPKPEIRPGRPLSVAPATTPKPEIRPGLPLSVTPAVAPTSKIRSPPVVSPLISTPTPRRPPRVRQPVPVAVAPPLATSAAEAAGTVAVESAAAAASVSGERSKRSSSRVGCEPVVDSSGKDHGNSGSASENRQVPKKEEKRAPEAEASAGTEETTVPVLRFGRSTRTRGGPSWASVAVTTSSSPSFERKRTSSGTVSGIGSKSSSGGVTASSDAHEVDTKEAQAQEDSKSGAQPQMEAETHRVSGGGGAAKRRNIIPDNVLSWGKLTSSRPPPRQRRQPPLLHSASPPAERTGVSASSSRSEQKTKRKAVGNEESSKEDSELCNDDPTVEHGDGDGQGAKEEGEEQPQQRPKEQDEQKQQAQESEDEREAGSDRPTEGGRSKKGSKAPETGDEGADEAAEGKRKSAIVAVGEPEVPLEAEEADEQRVHNEKTGQAAVAKMTTQMGINEEGRPASGQSGRKRDQGAPNVGSDMDTGDEERRSGEGDGNEGEERGGESEGNDDEGTKESDVEGEATESDEDREWKDMENTYVEHDAGNGGGRRGDDREGGGARARQEEESRDQRRVSGAGGDKGDAETEAGGAASAIESHGEHNAELGSAAAATDMKDEGDGGVLGDDVAGDNRGNKSPSSSPRATAALLSHESEATSEDPPNEDKLGAGPVRTSGLGDAGGNSSTPDTGMGEEEEEGPNEGSDEQSAVASAAVPMENSGPTFVQSSDSTVASRPVPIPATELVDEGSNSEGVMPSYSLACGKKSATGDNTDAVTDIDTVGDGIVPVASSTSGAGVTTDEVETGPDKQPGDDNAGGASKDANLASSQTLPPPPPPSRTIATIPTAAATTTATALAQGTTHTSGAPATTAAAPVGVASGAGIGTAAARSATVVEKRGASTETMTPCRTSGRRRIASNRAKDAEEDELRRKKNHVGGAVVAGGDGEGGAFAYGFGVGPGMGVPAAGALAFPPTVDPSVLAWPNDLFVCRYKDGYEEKLSLWRLRQLGAAFRYPRPPLTPAGSQARQTQTQAQGKKEGSGAAGVNLETGEQVYGSTSKFRRAAKPGASRIVGAMRLSTLWAHRGKESVVAVSIYDDPELLAAEIISLLAVMNEEGRDVGVTYWESPERKCLNECRLPLPEILPEVLNHDDSGGAAAHVQTGMDTRGRELGPGWVESPGGWKEPRHCHSGALIIWKAGAARYRAKGAGDFQEHCCAALLGSRVVPGGAETMLLDGFLHGTGVLQNCAVFRPYKRRNWFHKLTNGSGDGRAATVPTLPMLTLTALPGARFLVKKVGLQIGKVPRRQEAIYVCSPPAAVAPESSNATPDSAPDAGESASTLLSMETKKSGGSPVTAPWWTLTGIVPYGRGVPMTVEGGPKEPYHPHFLACIVCQRGGGPSTSDNADVSTTKMNDSGNSTSLSSENGLPTAETSANDLAPGFSITQPASAQTAGPSSTSTDSRDSSGSGSGKGSEKRSETTGPLLLCTTCPASFHLPCLRPRLRKMPEGQWSCAYCYATGRARGGDSDGACGAVRLMESLRQGVHGAVRVNTVRTLRYNAIG